MRAKIYKMNILYFIILWIIIIKIFMAYVTILFKFTKRIVAALLAWLKYSLVVG